MHASDIDAFMNKVKGRRIRMNVWKESEAFVPSGLVKYDPNQSLVVMVGDLWDGGMFVRHIALAVLNGFNSDPNGIKWMYSNSNELEVRIEKFLNTYGNSRTQPDYMRLVGMLKSFDSYRNES